MSCISVLMDARTRPRAYHLVTSARKCFYLVNLLTQKETCRPGHKGVHSSPPMIEIGMFAVLEGYVGKQTMSLSLTCKTANITPEIGFSVRLIVWDQ